MMMDAETATKLSDELAASNAEMARSNDLREEEIENSKRRNKILIYSLLIIIIMFAVMGVSNVGLWRYQFNRGDKTREIIRGIEQTVDYIEDQTSPEAQAEFGAFVDGFVIRIRCEVRDAIQDTLTELIESGAFGFEPNVTVECVDEQTPGGETTTATTLPGDG